MKSLFTLEELLQYLYKETSAEQSKAIEEALATDWTLKEKFEVLKAAANRLNKLKFSPSTESVLNILHYAADSKAVTNLN
jgi:hypothetical protein